MGGKSGAFWWEICLEFAKVVILNLSKNFEVLDTGVLKNLMALTTLEFDPV